MSEQKRLGEMLVEAEAISREDLLRALEVQRDTGERLGSVLLRLRMVDAGLLSKVLGLQQSFEGVNPCEIHPTAEAIHLVSAEIAMRYGCIPLWLENDTLAIAMTDPRDEEVVAALRAHTSKDIKRFIAPQSAIFLAIKAHYGTLTIPVDMKELRSLVSALRRLVKQLENLVAE
jgi:type IV pilus assembly protein PilB